jgi:hypothetical protein
LRIASGAVRAIDLKKQVLNTGAINEIEAVFATLWPRFVAAGPANVVVHSQTKPESCSHRSLLWNNTLCYVTDSKTYQVRY